MGLLLLSVSGQAAEDPVIFDGYRWGIHSYSLTVKTGGDSAGYSLVRKNLQENRWEEPQSTGRIDDSNREQFKLVGSITDFVGQYVSLAGTDWRGNTAVGWPDADNIYVRQKQLSAVVDRQVVNASYWALRDGTRPMDLVIGADNEIIAAIDVSNDNVMVRRGYEAFTTVARWRSQGVSQPDYGYRDLGLQWVPTDSGEKLATLVYLPKVDEADEGGESNLDGPFPTIFIRTPYGISNWIERYQHHVLRGYALVIQAAKGTAYWDPDFRSQGNWDAMAQEPADGADALDWITEQDWSNGEVCMQGASYYGYTQWALTMDNNPALKCIIPEVSMGTAFSDQPYMGGTFVQGLAYYVFWMTNNPILPDRNWVDIMRHRPLIEMDTYATGVDIPVWNTYFKHWRNDAFWKQQDWYEGEHPREVATFQISGWFDDDYPGTRSNWALAERYGTKANRLLVGPWKHGYNADRALNGYKFGARALRDDVWLLKQQWFDYHLKGLRNGVTDTRVDYFVLGANEWRQASTWPPEDADNQTWYFHSTGKANSHSLDGKLSRTAPKKSQPVEEFLYDPKNPVQNWYSFDLMESWADMQSFPYDFKDIETRSDVAIYTTGLLEEDVTMAGNIKVILYASTDVKDTDWWAYVSDVAPDNSSNRLSVGVMRARFRNLDDPDYHVFGSNFETEEFLSGNIDDVVRYEISIPSVANTFKKGHRIRVALMNAHDNYSFPNSNTGGEEGLVLDTVVGTMRIHHSKKYPSAVILPILK